MLTTLITLGLVGDAALFMRALVLIERRCRRGF